MKVVIGIMVLALAACASIVVPAPAPRPAEQNDKNAWCNGFGPHHPLCNLPWNT